MPDLDFSGMDQLAPMSAVPEIETLREENAQLRVMLDHMLASDKKQRDRETSLAYARDYTGPVPDKTLETFLDDATKIHEYLKS